MNTENVSTHSEKKKIVYPRKCYRCSEIFETKSSHSEHWKMCVKNKLMYPRICHVCKKSYATPPSFSRHKKKCKALLNIKKSSFDMHDYTFKKDLTDETAPSEFKCLFLECDFGFNRLKLLGTHLLVDHKVKVVEEISFDTFSSFKQWLELESMTTNTKFKKTRGSIKKNNEIRHFYACNYFRPTVFTRRTNRRNKKGTIPRDINCPVRIFAHEKNKKVKIYYFFFHNHISSSEIC